MEWINLLDLYGNARETSPDWSRRLQQLPQGEQPRNTRERRRLILDLEQRHRHDKKDALRDWLKNGKLELPAPILKTAAPLVYKRLKKIQSDQVDQTGLPVYNQDGIMADMFFDAEASYYQEYLLQESYYIPCAVKLASGETIDPVVLDFPPVDTDALNPEKLILGSNIIEIRPSEYLMAPRITHQFVELEFKDKEPSEVLIGRAGDRSFLLQDSEHGRSPLFFKADGVKGTDLDPDGLERSWHPSPDMACNEFSSKDPSLGLLGLATLKEILRAL